MRKILLSGFLVFFIISATAAPAGLQRIPKEDQKALTVFFKTLLSQGNFASTLFGCKASTCFDYPPMIILMIGDPKIKNRFISELQGWRIWDKYRDLFKIEKYLFLKLKNDYPSILFVHKEKLLSVVNQHQPFLQQYLPFDPMTDRLDSFLVQALVPNFHLKNFHFVQGILLGYEAKSCLDFQERLKIEGTLSFFPYDIDCDTRLHSPKPTELLDGYPIDLIKKAAQYKAEFSMKKCWSDANPFFCTSSPAFMAFEEHPIAESEVIKEKIATLFNSDHFLEDFMGVLTE